MKGLLVHVFAARYRADCSNNGITKQYDQLVLFGADGPFEPRDGMPPLLLKNKGPNYLYAVPCNNAGEELERRGEVGPMFGGNFVYTSDSRLPSKAPIPVHDRWESQELYDANFN